MFLLLEVFPLDYFMEKTIFELHVVLVFHFDIYCQTGLQKVL